MIWPIEEMFARRKFSRKVRERIAAFYPDGKEEGSTTRGLFRKPISWRRAKRMAERGRQPGYFRQKGGKVIYAHMMAVVIKAGRVMSRREAVNQ